VKKIVATIEARMTSNRLPGKVLLPAAGAPLLEHMINRVKKVKQLDSIVLATTTNKTDDVLKNLADNLGIICYRGSEENVMQRVIEAGESVGADIMVELTGDCPLIDPLIIEQILQLYIHNECDYASNADVRSFPIGMDTQVYSLTTLKKSYELAKDPLDFEHVTRHIRQNPQLFKKLHLCATSNLHWPDLALTLDEKEDYVLIKNIFEYFYDKNPDFTCQDILILLKEIKPEWQSINEKIRRKGLNS